MRRQDTARSLQNINSINFPHQGGRDYINIIRTGLLLFSIMLLAGCVGEDNLIDGDQQLTGEMNEVISDYILEKYEDAYYGTVKQFEVHKIYGTSESKGVINVYMWSYYGGFNKATVTETQSGHSLPAVIQLSKTDDHYKVTDYKEPKDGSLYQSSLEKMFPKKYVKSAKQDSGNIDNLQKEMEQKVENWLETQE